MLHEAFKHEAGHLGWVSVAGLLSLALESTCQSAKHMANCCHDRRVLGPLLRHVALVMKSAARWVS